MTELLRRRYARGLEKLGYRRVEGRTNRYWVFYGEAKSPAWVFLGKAGGVRYNSVQRIADSTSAGEEFKLRLREKAREQ